MSRAALAETIFVSESLVAAWESGRNPVKPEHMKRLFEALPLGPDMLFHVLEDLVSGEVAPEWMGKWLDIERQATSLLTYEPLLVPGLLQTEPYAREVIVTSGRPTGAAEAHKLVQARLERQVILDREDLMFVAVMDEGVLHRLVRDAATMRDQLAHLVEMAQRPNVMLQIVPAGAGAYPGLAGGFVLAGFDGQEFAYVDDVFSGDVIERSDDVEVVKRIWETIRNETLPGKQSVERIEDVAKTWTA